VSTHRFELICAPLLRSALLTSGDDCPEFEKTLFLREMETMIRMRHPNVVQFLGYVDSPFAIALEFLPSGDLKAYWQKNRLSVAKKMGICVDVLRALAYMHNRKPKACIHRDVKPANIMMSRSGVAKLSDFGLARMTQFARKERSDHGGLQYVGAESPGAKDDGSNDNSKLSKEVGTKRYMAPEATAQVYTSAVDIFSAGATFYELFEQSNFEPPRPLWAIAPGSVRQLIGQMCAANAAERPTAIGLIDSFESLQNGRRTRQPSVQFDAAAQAKMSACCIVS